MRQYLLGPVSGIVKHSLHDHIPLKMSKRETHLLKKSFFQLFRRNALSHSMSWLIELSQRLFSLNFSDFWPSSSKIGLNVSICNLCLCVYVLKLGYKMYFFPRTWQNSTGWCAKVLFFFFLLLAYYKNYILQKKEPCLLWLCKTFIRKAARNVFWQFLF